MRRAALALSALALTTATLTRAVDAGAEPPVRLARVARVEPSRPAPPEPLAPEGPGPVDYEAWRGTSFGAFLSPKGEFWGDDGGVDVVVHFNAAMLAGRSWQRSHARAVIVSAAFGSFGSGPYQEAMADPGRFGRMLAEVVAGVEAQKRHKGLHVRRLAIVAWSAGFGAVGRVLSVPRYFEQIDSLILLDALQAGYKDPSRGIAQGPEHVSLAGLAPYIRFAREAREGKKQLVVTHTSIVPPEYSSTTDAALALVGAVGAERRACSDVDARGMQLRYRVEEAGLRVYGFRGAGPDDHMRHLHMVGDVVREHLAPRWGAGGR